MSVNCTPATSLNLCNVDFCGPTRQDTVEFLRLLNMLFAFPVTFPIDDINALLKKVSIKWIFETAFRKK